MTDAKTATVTLWREDPGRIVLFNGFSFVAHAIDADHFFLGIDSSAEQKEALKSKLARYEKVYCSLTADLHLPAVTPIVDERWLFGGPAISSCRTPPVENYYQGKMECLLNIPESTTFTDYWTGHPDLPAGKPYFITCGIGSGCYWNRCTFCDYRSYDQSLTRRPDIAQILSQLTHPESTCLVHLCFAACTPQILKEILASGQSGRFMFVCFIRADKALTEFVRNYDGSMAGIFFSIGIESFSPGAMAILNKGFDFEAVLELSRAALERHATVEWNIMDSLPFLDATMADDYEWNAMCVALKWFGNLSIYNNGPVIWPDVETAARFGPYEPRPGGKAISIIRRGTPAYDANVRAAAAILNSEIALNGEKLGAWLG